MKVLTSILNLFGFSTARQREITAHRSEGAKRGWAKRRKQLELELPPPDDIQ